MQDLDTGLGEFGDGDGHGVVNGHGTLGTARDQHRGLVGVQPPQVAGFGLALFLRRVGGKVGANGHAHHVAFHAGIAHGVQTNSAEEYTQLVGHACARVGFVHKKWDAQ